MFVQDDQIRFADKGSESGAVRGRKSCIMHVPAARPMSGAGTACLGTSYEWGRRVVSSCCFRSCFPSAVLCCLVKSVLRRMSCEGLCCVRWREKFSLFVFVFCAVVGCVLYVGRTSEY